MSDGEERPGPWRHAGPIFGSAKGEIVDHCDVVGVEPVAQAEQEDKPQRRAGNNSYVDHGHIRCLET